MHFIIIFILIFILILNETLNIVQNDKSFFYIYTKYMTKYNFYGLFLCMVQLLSGVNTCWCLCRIRRYVFIVFAFAFKKYFHIHETSSGPFFMKYMPRKKEINCIRIVFMPLVSVFMWTKAFNSKNCPAFSLWRKPTELKNGIEWHLFVIFETSIFFIYYVPCLTNATNSNYVNSVAHFCSNRKYPIEIASFKWFKRLLKLFY